MKAFIRLDFKAVTFKLMIVIYAYCTLRFHLANIIFYVDCGYRLCVVCRLRATNDFKFILQFSNYIHLLMLIVHCVLCTTYSYYLVNHIHICINGNQIKRQFSTIFSPQVSTSSQSFLFFPRISRTEFYVEISFYSRRTQPGIPRISNNHSSENEYHRCHQQIHNTIQNDDMHI